jgi:hypothetical protein
MIFASSCLVTSTAFGHTTYTGYSGAPGSSGRCASSCHGASGGTIQVSGFPEQYAPGQSYVITVSHNGGNSIRQFNGSCRIGTGTHNAGVIAAGMMTVIYNASGETNGIHLSTTNQNSATFNWTAPQSGTGSVKLYIAGQQGGSSGPNTSLVLTASEQLTGLGNAGNTPGNFTIISNYPNPFNAQTTFEYQLPQASHVLIEINDLLGRKTVTLVDGNKAAGSHRLVWNASDIPSGIYFARIQTESASQSIKLVLLK